MSCRPRRKKTRDGGTGGISVGKAPAHRHDEVMSSIPGTHIKMQIGWQL